MYSFKNNVLQTLRRYNTSPLQDVFKIPLGCAVLLALKRPLGHKLDGVHLCPPDLDMGKGQACALDAERPLDNVQPRTCIHQPLHEAEVVAGYSFGRPHPDYQILHGQFGRPMQLDQLFQLIGEGHWMFWRKVL